MSRSWYVIDIGEDASDAPTRRDAEHMARGFVMRDEVRVGFCGRTSVNRCVVLFEGRAVYAVWRVFGKRGWVYRQTHNAYDAERVRRKMNAPYLKGYVVTMPERGISRSNPRAGSPAASTTG